MVKSTPKFTSQMCHEPTRPLISSTNVKLWYVSRNFCVEMVENNESLCRHMCVMSRGLLPDPRKYHILL